MDSLKLCDNLINKILLVLTDLKNPFMLRG